MEVFNSESEVRVGDIDNKHVRLSMCRLRAHRVKLAPRVKPKKISSTSTTKWDQQVISAIPCHTVFIFLNPQLLGALQVVYQGDSKKSPFETHPYLMWTFVTSMCFYSVVLGFKIHVQARSGHFAVILNHALLVSGSLSSASLLSIFQPRLFVWFLSIIGVYIVVMLVLRLLKNPLLKVLGTLVTLTFQLVDNIKLFVGRIRQWGNMQN